MSISDNEEDELDLLRLRATKKAIQDLYYFIMQNMDQNIVQECESSMKRVLKTIMKMTTSLSEK